MFQHLDLDRPCSLLFSEVDMNQDERNRYMAENKATIFIQMLKTSSKLLLLRAIQHSFKLTPLMPCIVLVELKIILQPRPMHTIRGGY